MNCGISLKLMPERVYSHELGREIVPMQSACALSAGVTPFVARQACVFYHLV